jgi:two-component system OmpR family sensor kinase
MKQILNSLYGKLSAIFLVLLLVLGAVQYYVSRAASMDFVAETDQKLNRTLARDLAKKFGPYLIEKADYGAIEHSFHELMVMNPRVEIYLIDEAGSLLAYFADPAKIKRMIVDMEPIRDYLNSDESLSMPIYGDDPRSVDRQKPFSVTPVQIGKGQAGYLYVILGGEQYDSVSSMVAQSYTVQTSAFVLGGAFALTGVAGLLLFFVLTKRLRVMTGTVQHFERGNFQERISIQTGDEIGQ